MSDLFSTGLSGLSIARTALATTAHNTANVYTEGYSRQSVVVRTSPPRALANGFVGTGAQATSVVRSYDDFLSGQLSRADSTTASLEAYSAQIGRLDDLLADSNSGLSVLMQGFFAGVQGVADTPADPAARQQMISSAQALAGKFRSLDGYLAELNGSVNGEVEASVAQINTIGGQIAVLNRQISQLSAAAGGQPPNDLLDTRDKLVGDLSKIVGVTVVRQDGGQYNIAIGAGHSLVLGDRASTVKAVRSAADPTRTALALDAVGGQPIELRDSDITGGSVGGLLAFRAQSLTTAQNAVGRMALVLADAFNRQHAAGVDLAGQAGQDFFSVGAPQAFASTHNTGSMQLAASVSDASSLTTGDYAVKVESGPGGALSFSVTRLPAGDAVPVTVAPAGAGPASFTSLTFEGITVAPAGAGTPSAGDSFLLAPTRHGARDFDVALADPARIAAGQGPGSGPSDSRNALALAGLQRQQIVGGVATLNGAYAGFVADIGNKAQEVQIAGASQSALAGQVRASLQSVSGVNQDEETANLLRYQQMYQANAKVIQAASELFDTILALR